MIEISLYIIFGGNIFHLWHKSEEKTRVVCIWGVLIVLQESFTTSQAHSNMVENDK